MTIRTYEVCRSLQLAGCLQPTTFNQPQDVKSRYFAGGTRRANLHKDGTFWRRSQGAGRKASSKAKLKIKQLPHPLRFDRNHFVIP